MNRWMMVRFHRVNTRVLTCAILSCYVFLSAATSGHAQGINDWRDAFAKVRPSMVTVIVTPPKSEKGDPLSEAKPDVAPGFKWVYEGQSPVALTDSDRADLRRAVVDVSDPVKVDINSPIIWRLMYNANAVNAANGVASVGLSEGGKRPNQINGIVFSSNGMVVAITGKEPVGDIQVMLPSGELIAGKVNAFDEITGASLIDIGRSAESCGLKPLEISDTPLEIGLPVGAAWTHVGSKAMVAGVGIVASDEILLGSDTVPVVETNIAIPNSANGGVIVNAQGQCVGIVNRMASQFGDIGNAYAIPAAVLKPLIEYTRNNQKRNLSRGRIGVSFEENTNRITKILPESPAQKAGFQPGDRIVRVRSKDVIEGKDAILELSRLRAGDTASFVVDRNGTKLDFDLELGANVIPNESSETTAPDASAKAEPAFKPAESPASPGNRSPNEKPAAQPAVPITRFNEQPEAFYRVLQVERTNIEASMQKLMTEITKLREELKAIRDAKK